MLGNLYNDSILHYFPFSTGRVGNPITGGKRMPYNGCKRIPYNGGEVSTPDFHSGNKYVDGFFQGFTDVISKPFKFLFGKGRKRKNTKTKKRRTKKRSNKKRSGGLWYGQPTTGFNPKLLGIPIN